MSPWAYVGIAAGALILGKLVLGRGPERLRRDNAYASRVCTKAGVLDRNCWENVNECDQFDRGSTDFKRCVTDARRTASR